MTRPQVIDVSGFFNDKRVVNTYDKIINVNNPNGYYKESLSL